MQDARCQLSLSVIDWIGSSLKTKVFLKKILLLTHQWISYDDWLTFFDDFVWFGMRLAANRGIIINVIGFNPPKYPFYKHINLSICALIDSFVQNDVRPGSSRVNFGGISKLSLSNHFGTDSLSITTPLSS